MYDKDSVLVPLPHSPKVHIVTVSLTPNDAIGNFVFSLADFLKKYLISSAVYAVNCAHELKDSVGSIQELIDGATPDDIVFFNFSIYDPYMKTILSLNCKSICYYHNITPDTFFNAFDPELARLCKDGKNQLPFTQLSDKLMANSEYSASELRAVLNEIGMDKSPYTRLSNVVVCPPVLNITKWKNIEPEQIDFLMDGVIFLSVGRIAAHKKVEDVIALFNAYNKLDSASALLVIGTVPCDGYGNYLKELISNKYEHLKQNITILGNLSDGQLKTAYEKSSIFISMSEHEGFCLPLVEAMYFKKPVFAYAHPAIRETLGGTGRVFYEKNFSAIASEIYNLVHDEEQLIELIEAQSQRFRQIARDADGRIILRTILEVLLG